MRGSSRLICLRTDAIFKQLQFAEFCKLSIACPVKLSPPAYQDKTPIRVNLLVSSFSLEGTIGTCNKWQHPQWVWRSLCWESAEVESRILASLCRSAESKTRNKDSYFKNRQCFIISMSCIMYVTIWCRSGHCLKVFPFFPVSTLMQLTYLCQLLCVHIL